MNLLFTSWNDAWHDSSLGYAYRKVGDKYEVIDQASGEWIPSMEPASVIEAGIKSGALVEIGHSPAHRESLSRVLEQYPGLTKA